MQASSFEYRFRFIIHGLIYILGLWAPWNYLLHLDPPGPISHVWGLLATNLSRIGLTANPFDLLLVLAIACAAAGAWVRTWGTAYVGTNIVNSSSMHLAQAPRTNDGILRDGPFAHMRNPLYLGTILHTLALVLLMPRSGAIFTLIAISVLQLRLIFAEEAFLTRSLAEPYAAYCALVPRLLPSLRRRVTPQGLHPRWRQAILGELYFWLVALAFAAAGWRYNTFLLIQCVVVALGVSFIARALTPKHA